jgi:CheY-like chemotaxis protein
MKVFIVDDTATVRMFMLMLVSKKTKDVKCFENGYAVLAAVTSGDIPDVIFLDIMMPGIDGIETCRRLKELKHKYRVVMLTTKGDMRSLAVAADDFLTKPVDLAAINRVLA